MGNILWHSAGNVSRNGWVLVLDYIGIAWEDYLAVQMSFMIFQSICRKREEPVRSEDPAGSSMKKRFMYKGIPPVCN